MARLLVYYAHPGQRFSHANAAMWKEAEQVHGITRVDLYAEYPRFNIDVDAEQARLLEHDVVLFQFPFFWYSTPSLIKEWFDLVLEHGFAYGKGGTKLAGKSMMVALTAAGPEDAYSRDGYQNFDLRTFLTPIEQTARLCKMHFLAPYVLHASLNAQKTGEISAHAKGYKRLLERIRDGHFDVEKAAKRTIIKHDDALIGEAK